MDRGGSGGAKEEAQAARQVTRQVPTAPRGGVGRGCRARDGPYSHPRGAAGGRGRDDDQEKHQEYSASIQASCEEAVARGPVLEVACAMPPLAQRPRSRHVNRFTRTHLAHGEPAYAHVPLPTCQAAREPPRRCITHLRQPGRVQHLRRIEGRRQQPRLAPTELNADCGKVLMGCEPLERRQVSRR